MCQAQPRAVWDPGRRMSEVADLKAVRDQALALFNAGRLAEAAPLLANVLAGGGADPDVLRSAGVCLASFEHFADAEPLIRQALLMRPRDPVALNALSACLMGLDRPAEAETAARSALAIFAAFPDALNNLGLALQALGRTGEALSAFETACRRAPDDPEIRLNRANALKDLDRPVEALAEIDAALVQDTTVAKAWYNRGNILQDLLRHKDAVSSYDTAIQLAPDDPGPHWNRSLSLLTLGEYDRGFEGYEWRWRNPAVHPPMRDFPVPRWTGEADPAGKTIWVHCEQGYGDAIQFIRYVPLLHGRGARVIVEALPAVADLFRSVEGVDAVITRGDAVPSVDLHCPLLSLPLALGVTGSPPPRDAPYLSPPEHLRARWRERMGPRVRARIGLCHAGSATHGNDRRRSLPLARLLSHLPTGADYFLLPPELRKGDEETLRDRPDVTWIGPELADFSDTAAVCLQLDAVVSVDTSLAHLAGALARPVLVLLPYHPDWRWGLARGDSDWHPTAELFRQTAANAWETALVPMQARLADVIGATPI